MKKQGFTFMELLIVIAIIAILSAIGVTSYQSINKRARDAKRESDLEQVRLALEAYRAKNGVYPADTEAGFETLSELDPGDGLGLLVPDYLPSIPTDPKSTTLVPIPYYYYSPSDTYSYCLCGGVENASEIKNECIDAPLQSGCNYYVRNP